MQRSIESYLKRKAPAEDTASITISPAKKQKTESVKEVKTSPKEDKENQVKSDDDIQERIRKNREAALAKLKARKDDDKKGIPSALEPSWKNALRTTMSESYFKALQAFLEKERSSGVTIYPPPAQVYSAFNHCSLKKVKVVIIGQDPYHGPGQAMGMSFSVPNGVPPPPSLKNIYKELEDDIPGFKAPKHGCLEKWAQQGVLLLNTTLTVQRGRAASHRGKGWERFTDVVVQTINNRKAGVVFLLWGGHAKTFTKRIGKAHSTLTAPHPSPLSAHKGWFSSKHFSKTNTILKKANKKPIDWTLDD